MPTGIYTSPTWLETSSGSPRRGPSASMPPPPAGAYKKVVRIRRAVPDGLAFDMEGRIWIGCHRPDAIYVYDPNHDRLELFCHDWRGDALRGPTDVAFAGPKRDVLLAASLDNLV